MVEPVTITLASVKVFLAFVNSIKTVVTTVNLARNYATDLDDVVLQLELLAISVQTLVEQRRVLRDDLVTDGAHYKTIQHTLILMKNHFEYCAKILKWYRHENRTRSCPDEILSADLTQEIVLPETEPVAPGRLITTPQSDSSKPAEAAPSNVDVQRPQQAAKQKKRRWHNAWNLLKPKTRDKPEDKQPNRDTELFVAATSAIDTLGIEQTGSDIEDGISEYRKHTFCRAPWVIYDKDRLEVRVVKIRNLYRDLDTLLKRLTQRHGQWVFPQSPEVATMWPHITRHGHTKPSEIYYLCQSTIMTAVVHTQDGKKYLENASARLKLWGVGLFDPKASLDDLISAQSSTAAPVRKMFFKCSTLMLAHIESILKTLFKQCRSNGLTEALQLIAIALSADELKPYLIGQLEIALEQERYSKHVSEDLVGTKLVADSKEVCRMVEFLFELLPSVSILRGNYWFYRTDNSKGKKSTVDAAAGGINSHRSASTTMSIEDVEVIEHFLRRRDEEMQQLLRQRKIPDVTLYEPIFRRETERLREIQHSTVESPSSQIQLKALELIESLAQDIKTQQSHSQSANKANDLVRINSADAKGHIIEEADLQYFISSLQELEGRTDSN